MYAWYVKAFYYHGVSILIHKKTESVSCHKMNIHTYVHILTRYPNRHTLYAYFTVDILQPIHMYIHNKVIHTYVRT